jgi:SNF family Na+-dependent transporter
MGIMTSYGSYNPKNQNIIKNNMIISISNSLLSIVSGFAVFSIIGFLKKMNNPLSDKTSSLSLAFIAYPTATLEMPGSNFWSLLLAITLFTLGIDSAFSLIEAVSTVIYDTEVGNRYPRMFIALVLCIFGCGMSAIFCTNWGFILFDVVDHYTAVYLMIFIGIAQCFGVGWGNDVAEATEKYG